MGLDIYLKWDEQTKEEHDAQITGFANAGKHGYLRSSYNDLGFNSWARNYIDGKDLYFIFQPPPEENMTEDDYEDGFKVKDWDACESRRLEALEEAKKAVDKPMVIECRPHNVHKDVQSVIEAYMSEMDENKTSFTDYSNAKGDFFKEGITINAVMVAKSYFGHSVCLVCEPSDHHKWYIDMLEQDIKEFIKLGKDKDARIVWSG